MGPKIPHVAVIGAGISGLRCAEVLGRGGFKVSVIEARDRIGGRAHQDDSLGHLVDLGPNWIHGHGSGNPMSRLASNTGTILHKWNDDAGMIVDSKGRLLSADEAERDSQDGWGYVSRAFKYSADNFESIDPGRSVKDYLEKEMMKDESDPHRVSAMLRVAEHMGGFPGEDLSQLSLKCFYLEDSEEEDAVFVASTYRSILQEIARYSLANSDVRFNTEVVHIEHIQNSTRVRYRSGTDESFDAVVVSVPLGWLKTNFEAFEPRLPPRITSALADLSFGRLEKCYVTFPTAWWSTTRSHDEPEKLIFREQADNDNISSNGTMPENAPYPGYVSYHAPDYVSHPADSSWSHECMMLSTLRSSVSHPTLLFYIFGECGASMVSSIEGLRPQSAKYNNVLSTLLSPFYSRLPNYDPSSSECIPMAFLATQWSRDPHAGCGSYTNVQVGAQDAEAAFGVLQGGVPEHRLWLAGEHTAGAHYFATTTGAYLSGQAAAEKVCRYFKTNVSLEAS